MKYDMSKSQNDKTIKIIEFLKKSTFWAWLLRVKDGLKIIYGSYFSLEQFDKKMNYNTYGIYFTVVLKCLWKKIYSYLLMILC